jgi:hypothetical protein
MAEDASDQPPPHSPRTRGIIQHFERQVRLQSDALNEDIRVTNERIGQLESVQMTTNNTLTTLQRIVEATNTSFAAIIDRLNRMDISGHGVGNNMMAMAMAPLASPQEMRM